ncbi:bifunctional 4-hydroxy-2-oxoglutarate aldolase/2-dehydro-3-deoxy-phosphogluconate aldolase [Pseudarthrobacter sp. 1C304]|uniref:bifunctional 4-hydroxy-2-oxoglutarate aldolase/2-dehydro-3-deoxy-phosphogluconate aldolase n=1 Tax=Pseudarthrobacter sp. 1C304 TaxID=3457438 RepID=UPI003FD3CEB6
MTHPTPASEFGTLLGEAPVMAILRGYGTERTLELSRVAWSVGITCIEVPLQSQRDAETLAAVAEAAAAEGCVVGAGTILDVNAVSFARSLGAAFTVSPGFDPEVARASLDAGMPHLPGVATATEVHHARRFGLGWLKAFPASDLGAAWITALRAPFPDVRFVATGGISATNAQDFLYAGASAVAVGSALSDTAQLNLLGVLSRRKSGV